nr:cobalamin-dependent protein [Desulfobulbaceae bacterium]
MNILLISPNTLTVPYPVYPIGLDYVAGSVSKAHQVRIADMNVETYESLGRILKEFAPDIIGVSCRNIDNTDAGDSLFCVNEYRDVIAWLRRHSNACIVCGGSGFTILPESVFDKLGADYGVIGEGERFGLLVEALSEGRNVTEIPGIISKFSSSSTPQPWSGVLNRDFRTDSAHNQFYMKRGGVFNLQTKRGCTFNCIYCPYPHIEGRRHRLSEPGAVAETAISLQKAGAKYLFITDSAFNSDLEHSLAVAKAFKSAGLSTPWGAFFAPIKHPENYFRTMAEAGLTHVEFGTESLSDLMLTSYHKPFRANDVFKAHNEAVEAGLHVAHYFLLGGPGESAATVNDCLDKIEGLNKTVLFFFLGIRIYPHTQLYDIALAEGKISSSMEMLEPVFYAPDAISLDEINELVQQRAGQRINWIFGSGGTESSAVVSRMHEKGYVGPLWEYLVR